MRVHHHYRRLKRYAVHFFQDEKENHLTDKQNEVMEIWNDLSADEQAVVLAMLRGLKK